MSNPDPDDDNAPMTRKDWLLWGIVVIGFLALVGAPLAVLWWAYSKAQMESAE
jgi:hypothetical protein